MQTNDKVKINFDNLPRGLHRDTSGNPKDTGVIVEIEKDGLCHVLWPNGKTNVYWKNELEGERMNEQKETRLNNPVEAVVSSEFIYRKFRDHGEQIVGFDCAHCGESNLFDGEDADFFEATGINMYKKVQCKRCFKLSRLGEDNSCQPLVSSEMREVLGLIDNAITKSNDEIELADAVTGLCHNIDEVIRKHDESNSC